MSRIVFIRYSLLLCFLCAMSINTWADALNDANAAVAAYEQGKYDEAIQLSTIAMDRGLPGEGRWAMLGIRGNAYRGKGQFDSAIEDYNEAIRLKTDDFVTMYNRGIAYFDKGQYARAIEDYNEAIRIKPDYSAAFHNRGIAYYRLGQRDRALKDWEQAFHIDPKHQPDPSLVRDQ